MAPLSQHFSYFTKISEPVESSSIIFCLSPDLAFALNLPVRVLSAKHSEALWDLWNLNCWTIYEKLVWLIRRKYSRWCVRFYFDKRNIQKMKECTRTREQRREMKFPVSFTAKVRKISSTSYCRSSWAASFAACNCRIRCKQWESEDWR